MNATAIILIAVGVFVVLGAVAFFTLARRSDVRGAGALSHETMQRDRAARSARPVEPVAAGATAAEVEAAGRDARTGTSIEPATEMVPVPWSPPDPDALAVS